MISSPVSAVSADHGLGGEHQRAERSDFVLGSGPLTVIERLHGELDRARVIKRASWLRWVTSFLLRQTMK